MVIVKESRKEFDNLFEDGKAILGYKEKYGGKIIVRENLILKNFQ